MGTDGRYGSRTRVACWPCTPPKHSLTSLNAAVLDDFSLLVQEPGWEGRGNWGGTLRAKGESGEGSPERDLLRSLVRFRRRGDRSEWRYLIDSCQ